MAANNIGVPKRIPAPNTIERVGIGDGGSDPSAPKPKQASPAFTFGGAGSGTALHTAFSFGNASFYAFMRMPCIFLIF